MARLEEALQLRRLSDRLSACSQPPASPRHFIGALRRLGAGRPRLLKGLRLVRRLGLRLGGKHPKQRLWSAVAEINLHQARGCSYSMPCRPPTPGARQATRWSSNRTDGSLEPSRQTQGLRHCCAGRASPTPRHRHHDDHAGYAPSWPQALQAIQQAGWTVVVSFWAEDEATASLQPAMH